jgi:hypothetical protein
LISLPATPNYGGSLSAQQSLLAYAFAEKARQALKEFIERKQPLKR